MLFLLFFHLLGLIGFVPAVVGQCAPTTDTWKPRVFVLTDMSNEPDDQMSLVRFLTYANEFDIAGIAGVTSTHKNNSIDLETIRQVITAYGEVVDNLNVHVPEALPYPSGDDVLAKVSTGHPVYGKAALDLDLSESAQALIDSADAASEADDALWVSVWGGANVLAEALNHVSETREADAILTFVSTLRVYSISDQDDTGAWLRIQYPKLFFIVSLHGWDEYSQATWSGISGEVRRHFDVGGPDTSLVTNEWLDQHVRNVSSLGAHYPIYPYIMEGDTPSFFPLVQNGLHDIDHPEWGGWGGRYALIDRTRYSMVFSDVADWARGVSGDFYLSPHVSVWRWRQAFQFDFAARMQWTATNDYTEANHHPVAVVNGTCGPSYMEIGYTSGNALVLDASESWDPDGDDLTFEWFHYREPTMRLEASEIPEVSPYLRIEALDESGAVVRVTPTNRMEMHLILTIRDEREMGLTTYRRIIMKPQ